MSVVRPAGKADGSACAAPESLVRPLRYGFVREFVAPPAPAEDRCVADLLRCAELWLCRHGIHELHAIAPPDPADPLHGRYARHGFTPLLFRLARAAGAAGQPGQATIRPATPDDLPALADLVRTEVELQTQLADWFRLTSKVDWSGYVAARLRCQDVRILVAGQGGKLAGYAEFSLAQRRAPVIATVAQWLRRSPPALGSYSVVEDVFVTPEVRGQGIAAQLVQQGCGWLRSCGVQNVAAGVWAGNTASLNFFVRRLGFTVVGVQLRRSFASAAENVQ